MKIKMLYLIIIYIFSIFVSLAYATTYTIEESSKDVVFQINGIKFYAQSWCTNIKKGDRVEFKSVDPFGSCLYAEFINLRTNQACKILCNK